MHVSLLTANMGKIRNGKLKYLTVLNFQSTYLGTW